MVAPVADNRNPDSLASRMRRRRMQRFVALLEPFREPVRILDVGGRVGFWQVNAPVLPKKCEITVLNLEPLSAEALPNVVSVVGDARRMTQFADKAFDVCFSNSTIEHVGRVGDQQAMAQEVQRVSRAYFVQTPNRWFPLEPHFLFPFWQFLPLSTRAWLHHRFDRGWHPRQPDPQLARAEVMQVRLLTARELAGLFPGADIVREKVGPLSKSLMAVRSPEAGEWHSSLGNQEGRVRASEGGPWRQRLRVAEPEVA